MRRMLRSKPVLIIGGGALARRMMNKAQMRRKKRRNIGRKITALALASAAGGAVKYFSDSISGPRRRQKVMRLIGKGEQEQSVNGDSQGRLQLQDPAPSQT